MELARSKNIESIETVSGVAGTQAALPRRAYARGRRPSSRVVALEIPPQEEQATVRRIAAYVAHGALEVLAGTRPAQQLAGILDQQLFASLLMRAELTNRARRAVQHNPERLHQSIQVRSVHGSRVAAGIYELSIVVAERARYRAVAIRIEQQGGNWKVTALLIG